MENLDQSSRLLEVDPKPIIEKLEKALREKDVVSMCEYSRDLTIIIDHVFKHPESWPRAIVEHGHQLLLLAEEKTQGTKYESHCHGRAAYYLGHVRSLEGLRSSEEAMGSNGNWKHKEALFLRGESQARKREKETISI